MGARLTFAPVTSASWSDFEALFEAPGGPKYCWCMAWRASPSEIKEIGKASRKPLLKDRVDHGTTVGLVGSLAGEPVAWVSIAPRETYRDLGGPDALPDERIWSLACLYLKRAHRSAGLGREMLEAAITYARDGGARIVEAYPVDPESPSYRFMGFVPAFERLGFVPVGMAGSRRHVMRLPLA